MAPREPAQRPGRPLLIAAEGDRPARERAELERPGPAPALARDALGEGERRCAILVRRRAAQPAQQHLTHGAAPFRGAPRCAACL